MLDTMPLASCTLSSSTLVIGLVDDAKEDIDMPMVDLNVNV